MTILEPLTKSYPNFKEDYLEECDGGYRSTGDYTAIFDFGIGEIDKLRDYKSISHGCAIYYEEFLEEGKVRVTVTSPRGMFIDGVTYAIDKATRMMFAFYHDIACYCSQETGDSSYEDLFDSLAYEIITEQGGTKLDGSIVEIGVEIWDSTN